MSAIKPNPAIVTVSFRTIRGEPAFYAEVRIGGPVALRIQEAPTERHCLLEVLDWSLRQGKEVQWIYLYENPNK